MKNYILHVLLILVLIGCASKKAMNPQDMEIDNIPEDWANEIAKEFNQKIIRLPFMLIKLFGYINSPDLSTTNHILNRIFEAVNNFEDRDDDY